MRTSTRFILSIAAGVFLLSSASPSQAQTTQDPMVMARRMARHFPEKPPVQFEIVQTQDHEPRMVITNLHQFPLTAFIVRTDPTAANSITNTLLFDALARTGLIAPIPRGLSFVTGVPHVVGEAVPDPVLAAAVWEDGSTFGPDDLLARISSGRSALADSYDRAIAMLQTGLDKNWTAAEYSVAAQQLKLQRDAAQSVAPRPATENFLPIHTIATNMDHIIQENRPAKRATQIARALLTRFTQDRDALRAALNQSPLAQE
jgi:hypothetical protein